MPIFLLFNIVIIYLVLGLFFIYLHLTACVSFYIVYYLIYKATILFLSIYAAKWLLMNLLLRNNYLRISISLNGNDLIRKYSLLFREPWLFMTLAKHSFFIAQGNV